MIATITLNPALDKTVYVRGLIVGDTNRIERTEVDAGGKGINASRMLAELGAETVALGFIGGRTGAFIEHVLSQEGIKTDFVQTRVETRTNVDVQDLDGVPPTCLNERGGPITADELEKLKETVRVWARKCRVMILGGSIPQGIEPGIYRDLIEIVRKEGAKTILDADNEPLTLGLHAHPTMVKPNIDEAARLMGRELTTIDDVAEAARSMVGKLVEIAVVSMGKRGAVAATKDGVWQAVPPRVEAVSTVGSGDSMVAGIAFALAQGRTIAEGLALGSAAGSATAMSTGVEMGRKEDVDRLLASVVVNRLL
jgi:1-phosphofructokinase family hexose kinase